MIQVNECMVRAGLLVGLALGFVLLGYANIGGAVGIFAAVQLLNIVADARGSHAT
ncbi:MAG TPA: hypothetical protein VFM93_03385 [Candidatus Limnocylindria bacterium]|nr:hypothetical protein [Candidatus Limnocylindria bacterium]